MRHGEIFGGAILGRTVFGATTLSAVLLGSAAFADVTPEQVWQDWQNISASVGQTVTAAEEERQGDVLIVSGVSITQTAPDSTVSGTIEELRFRETGDGSVEITMSPEYPINMVVTPPEGEPYELDMVLRQQGLVMIATGVPERVDYDYSADEITLAMQNVPVGDTEAEGEPARAEVNMTLRNMTGDYRMAEDGQMSSDLAASALSFTLNGSGLEGGADMSVTAEDVEIESTFSNLDMTGMETLSAAVREGTTMNVVLRYGAGAYDFTVVDEGGSTSDMTGGAGSGSLGFSIDESGLSYTASSMDTRFNLSSSAMMFPEIAATVAETGTRLIMPLLQGDAPQDFTFATRLVDLVVNDEIWDMLDPERVLPRTPASMIIDTAGTATLLADLDDEAAMASDETPVELNSLTINEFRLAAGGADLSGTGAFTFDNTDTDTYDGMPKPIGTLDLQLIGGHTLLDALVQLGFLPQDQAMGARMMMGLFTRPGADDNTLISTIEAREDGSIYANGQRIQ